MKIQPLLDKLKIINKESEELRVKAESDYKSCIETMNKMKIAFDEFDELLIKKGLGHLVKPTQ